MTRGKKRKEAEGGPGGGTGAEGEDTGKDEADADMGLDLHDDALYADIRAREEDKKGGKDASASAPASLDMHATATILLLRASLDDKDATIASLQADLRDAKAEREKWRSAVSNADFVPRNAPIDPQAVGLAVERLRSRERELRDLLMAGRRRETTLHVRLAATQQDLLCVRDELHQQAQQLAPQNMQTRRLMLDPAIHAQYSRLKSVSEALEKKVRELQDDLAAVQFTPHSKNGKMLMAKCRTLQEENDEIGREASEGKVHELENKLALQKQLNSELKRGYQELQEYVADINEETEKLQETIYKLQRQVQLREQELQELNRHKAATTDSRQAYGERGRDGSVEKERDSRRREGHGGGGGGGGKRSRHSRTRDDEAYEEYR